MKKSIYGFILLTLCSFSFFTLLSITNNYSDAQAKVRWNKHRSNQLKKYMQIWGDNREQHYSKYTPGNPIDVNGISYPTSFWNTTYANKKININKINWAKSAHGKAENNVVACYSNVNTNDTGKYTYLFFINDGVTNIWVSKYNPQTQKNNFYSSENPEISEAFDNIVNGKKVNYKVQQRMSMSDQMTSGIIQAN